MSVLLCEVFYAEVWMLAQQGRGSSIALFDIAHSSCDLHKENPAGWTPSGTRLFSSFSLFDGFIGIVTLSWLDGHRYCRGMD
jgi:hypothetical protein